MTSDTIWTDDLFAQLETHWNAGLSASEIGKKLGISKNSVVGKARRMGLAWRRQPVDKSGSHLDPLYWKTAADGCMFADGEPGKSDFKSCNALIFKKDYCEEHYNLIFLPPPKKKAKSPVDNYNPVNNFSKFLGMSLVR